MLLLSSQELQSSNTWFEAQPGWMALRSKNCDFVCYGLLFDFASSALAGHAGCGNDNDSNGGNDKDGCQRSAGMEKA